jgi:hypothetical protein
MAKKSLQSFHARTTLWKLFEIRAQEMDCSVDYLINEAMRLYATTHDFLQDYESSPPSPAAGMRQTSSFPTDTPYSIPPLSPQPAAHSTMPPSLPRPSHLNQRGQPSFPGQPARVPSVPVQHAPMGASEARSQLTLIFQGQKVRIPGKQFIIGRGVKASDLTIKDPNISRKHAAIIFHNGAYYLKDLGSTNGIEYKGQRVDSKRIDEGDVFSICDYQLHFTYTV